VGHGRERFPHLPHGVGRVTLRYPAVLRVAEVRRTWRPRRSVRGEGSRACRNWASAGPSPRALPRGAGRRPSRTLPADCAFVHEVRLYYARHSISRQGNGNGSGCQYRRGTGMIRPAGLRRAPQSRLVTGTGHPRPGIGAAQAFLNSSPDHPVHGWLRNGLGGWTAVSRKENAQALCGAWVRTGLWPVDGWNCSEASIATPGPWSYPRSC